MPFGLTKAPATCQQLVNDVFCKFLDVFVVVYLDDILIYTKKREDHTACIRKVLQKLSDAGLFVKGKKCEFSTPSTTFRSFVVGTHGISMDERKIQAIKEREEPCLVHDVQVFLGFANFYQCFISKYT